MTAELRARLGALIGEAGTGLAAADRLCMACVDVLEVDGAAISLVHDGLRGNLRVQQRAEPAPGRLPAHLR